MTPASTTAFLRDCQAIAAKNFYNGRTDPAAVWVMRWIGALIQAHDLGTSPRAAVAACRKVTFSPLRMGQS